METRISVVTELDGHGPIYLDDYLAGQMVIQPPESEQGKVSHFASFYLMKRGGRALRLHPTDFN